MADLSLMERIVLRKAAMDFLKAHWPWITATLGGALTIMVPGLAAIAAANPKTTVGILCAAIVAAYNATAPKDRKKK